MKDRIGKKISQKQNIYLERNNVMRDRKKCNAGQGEQRLPGEQGSPQARTVLPRAGAQLPLPPPASTGLFSGWARAALGSFRAQAMQEIQSSFIIT